MRVVIEPQVAHGRARHPDGVSCSSSPSSSSRIPLNMNVLDQGQRAAGDGPRARSSRSWLDHRKRGADPPLAAPARRDRAPPRSAGRPTSSPISTSTRSSASSARRTSPRPGLMKTVQASPTVQAEAILNMRLRTLRKLEEMELRTEHKALRAEEQEQLNGLLESGQASSGGRSPGRSTTSRRPTARTTPLGKRRRPSSPKRREHDDADEAEARLQWSSEPITVILSEKGWIRAMQRPPAPRSMTRGASRPATRLKLALPCRDHRQAAAALHRRQGVYTLGADRLPGGRGQGEPVRLMVDMEEGQDVVDFFVYHAGCASVSSPRAPGRRLHRARRTNCSPTPARASRCSTSRGGAEGRLHRTGRGRCSSPCIGENRKMVIFPMRPSCRRWRGKGVRLQNYKDGGASCRRPHLRCAGRPHLDRHARTAISSSR